MVVFLLEADMKHGLSKAAKVSGNQAAQLQLSVAMQRPEPSDEDLVRLNQSSGSGAMASTAPPATPIKLSRTRRPYNSV